ncbi:MAG: hypothetical protein GEU28_13305 [Dehalococcoidia bacterium]|nr:hypothetical protein [Dehalococcoidia bacterium]
MKWPHANTHVVLSDGVALAVRDIGDSVTPLVFVHGATREVERRALPAAVRRPVAALRNSVETTIGELTETLGLARCRTKTVWGLLTRTAATILAHTLLRLARVSATNPHLRLRA